MQNNHEELEELIALIDRTNHARFGRDDKSPAKQFVDCCSWVSPNTKMKLKALLPENQKRVQDVIEDEYQSDTLRTPKRSKMKLSAKVGPFTLFSSDQVSSPTSVDFSQLTNLDEMATYLAEPTSKAIRAVFTYDDLQAIKIQKNKDGNQRKTSQPKAMKSETAPSRSASANKIAAIIGIKNDHQQFEWTHLIAHRFVGENGQHHKNLVLATQECNTFMMYIEDAIVNLLSLQINTGVETILTVRATTIPNTHIATSIYYQIEIPELNFDLSIKFEPAKTTRPSKDYEDAIAAMFKYALQEQKKCVFHSPQSPQTQSLLDQLEVADVDDIRQELFL